MPGRKGPPFPRGKERASSGTPPVHHRTGGRGTAGSAAEATGRRRSKKRKAPTCGVISLSPARQEKKTEKKGISDITGRRAARLPFRRPALFKKTPCLRSRPPSVCLKDRPHRRFFVKPALRRRDSRRTEDKRRPPKDRPIPATKRSAPVHRSSRRCRRNTALARKKNNSRGTETSPHSPSFRLAGRSFVQVWHFISRVYILPMQ